MTETQLEPPSSSGRFVGTVGCLTDVLGLFLPDVIRSVGGLGVGRRIDGGPPETWFDSTSSLRNRLRGLRNDGPLVDHQSSVWIEPPVILCRRWVYQVGPHEGTFLINVSTLVPIPFCGLRLLEGLQPLSSYDNTGDPDFSLSFLVPVVYGPDLGVSSL